MNGISPWLFCATIVVSVLPAGAAEVGNWSLDEGAGTTVSDASGSGNHGSFVGSPAWTSGVSGGALELGGGQDRVVIPDSASLDITGAITIAAWIRPGKQGTQYVVKKARAKRTDGYELSLSSNGTVFVRFNQSSRGNTYRVSSLSPYPVDGTTWAHVSATYDGSEIKLYVDGVLEGTLSAPGLVIGTNGDMLSLGAQPDGLNPFQGALDQVHVYNVALDQVGIQQLILSERGSDPGGTPDSDNDGMPDSWEIYRKFDPLDPGDATQDADGDGVSNRDEYVQGTNPHDVEVGNWSLDEGEGVSVTDESSFRNHGDLVGSPTWSPGVRGAALHFVGFGDHVTVPDGTALDVAGAITIAAWIRPGRSGEQSVIKKGRHNATDGYELGLEEAPDRVFVRFNQSTAGDSFKVLSASDYPGDGSRWLHVAATYDRQKIKLYLDGALESSLDAPGLVIGTNDNGLSFGAQDDGNWPFQGDMDEVHVYRVALNDSEIRKLFIGEPLPDLDSWNENPLSTANTTAITGEKPQSKVWFFQDSWWAVFPDGTGFWIWRLEGSSWEKVLKLSSNTRAQADYEFGEPTGVVHVLMFDGTATDLASAEYVPGTPGSYRRWQVRPENAHVPMDPGTETATMAMDATGRLWVAYDTSSAVKVHYSDAADSYAIWSAEITVASGLHRDDIGAIVAFGGKVGVLWSNQNTQRFGFRYHFDWDDPTLWSTGEVPASQSALDVGAGMADDHINFAVGSDETLYAAVKTGYDTSPFPKVALLVRRPSGTWDDLHGIDTSGTRPIVVLNEATGSLVVVYTEIEIGGNIEYRVSDAQEISFGPRKTLMAGSNLNNPTSTKQSFLEELVVLASTSGSNKKVSGVLLAP